MTPPPHPRVGLHAPGLHFPQSTEASPGGGRGGLEFRVTTALRIEERRPLENGNVKGRVCTGSPRRKRCHPADPPAAATLSALPSFLLHRRVTAGPWPRRGFRGFHRKASSPPVPESAISKNSLNSWGRGAGHRGVRRDGLTLPVTLGLGPVRPPAQAPRAGGWLPHPRAGADRGQRWLRLGLRFQFRNVTVQT